MKKKWHNRHNERHKVHNELKFKRNFFVHFVVS